MRQCNKGGALLAVLWVSAALTAIAFSVAATVRSETERTSTHLDGVRTYYLATGAIERILLYAEWGPGPKTEDGTPKYWEMTVPRLHMQFPTGVVTVDAIPETAKVSLNNAPPQDILAVLLASGIPQPRAVEMTAAIVDWRTPAPADAPTIFDQHYLSLAPSFRARHASFREIEELLLVKGMTPDLFYGGFGRDEQGRLLPQPGLKDCFSVYATGGGYDVNYAQPAVLAAAGVPPSAIAMILERRRAAPFRKQEELAAIAPFIGPAMGKLRLGGNTVFTFRATARLRSPEGRESDLTRSVSATVKFHYNEKKPTTPPIEVLRWYDY